MHPEAREWVAKYAAGGPVTVLDLGGRDVNGSVRDLFPGALAYTVLDMLPGDGVDIVADAATWDPGEQRWDVIVAAEVFEHAAHWPAICRTAYRACRPGGTFIVTCAGPGRPPHSAIDGMAPLRRGEHYANVPAFELERVLVETGWRDVVVDSQPSPADTRAVAIR